MMPSMAGNTRQIVPVQRAESRKEDTHGTAAQLQDFAYSDVGHCMHVVLQ